MKNRFIDIVIRYLILLLVAIPNLYIFYFILTPLTLYPLYFLFDLFFDVALVANNLIFSGFTIEIIDACIAGSAYYLLLILNLSIPNIKLKKRLHMIGFAFLALLILNILRIFILGIVMSSFGYYAFDITHKIFWYLISIVIVIAIWFTEVKLYKIKEIPFYSDMKFLYKKSNLKK